MYVGVFTRGHVGVCRDEVSYTPAFQTTLKLNVVYDVLPDGEDDDADNGACDEDDNTEH
jgi:hypothetical protein